MSPSPADTLAGPHDGLLLDALHRIWGFSAFRPLQRDAMHAVLDGRDSVVVLPTGGGKSLCFQAPAVIDPPAWRRPAHRRRPAFAGLQGSPDGGHSVLRGEDVPDSRPD